MKFPSRIDQQVNKALTTQVSPKTRVHDRLPDVKTVDEGESVVVDDAMYIRRKNEFVQFNKAFSAGSEIANLATSASTADNTVAINKILAILKSIGAME